MTEYAENFPLEARALVDYKTKKVIFEYPDKNRFRAFLSVFSSIWLVWIIMWTSAGAIFAVFLFGAKILNAIGYLLLVFVIVPAVLSLLITFAYSKFAHSFPRFNYRLLRSLGMQLWEAKVSSIDSKTFEIPLFRNVFLDYEAQGDFGNYLEQVKVTEHPFLDLKDKKTPNLSLWKAIFTFSEIPKQGELKVRFM